MIKLPRYKKSFRVTLKLLVFSKSKSKVRKCKCPLIEKGLYEYNLLYLFLYEKLYFL